MLEAWGVESRNRSDYVIANHDYFSHIDSREKAYLLGWMITDGWNNEQRSQVGIQLQEGDGDTIKWIKNQWNSQHTILVCLKKPAVFPNGKIYQAGPMHRITVASKKMSSDLQKLGVTQRKTFSCFLPLLRVDLMSHLLRGVLDGDGTIYKHSTANRSVIRFVGSRYLIAQISLYLAMTLKIQQANIAERGNISLVEWFLPDETDKIFKYLYNNSEGIRLERKYEKIINRIM